VIAWSRVSAFGDEVDPDLDVQLACMKSLDIRLLEVRNAWGTSVVAMDDDELKRVRSALDAAGVGVSAIGSPVGKTDIADGWDVVESQLRRSLRAADILGTRLIRVFSFFVEPGEQDRHRDEVLERMRRMAAIAEAEGAVLVHENEKGIYGDTPERCVDLFENVDSRALVACFDVANFIQVGSTDVRRAWSVLAPYVRHVHVKDAQLDGTVTPAGEGAGDWAFLAAELESSGYDGLLTLEPHLDGVVPGSGCERLGVAAAGLRAVLESAVPAAPSRL
jgi:sugar phosphate isomerase/epimerase